MAAPDIGIRLSLDGAQQVEADLKRVSTGMQGVGVSAAQTAAAMRQVPAQVTDIVVSLQSGQAPLTVLLQQGGQLKDSFGGIGNAVKGVSSYLSGLVTSLGPVGIALTAVGGGAVLAATAMIQGAKEAEAYNRALIMTGNAAGVTVGQLQAQAKSVAALSGVTQGAAADALAQAAASGKVGAESLGIVTEAAVKLEKVGVQAVNKTIDQFAELGKSPVEASIKLNEQYGFLTAAVFKQIKALEEQGRASEAAEVAQRAFGEALSSRAGQISQNLGALEKAWKGVTDRAKGAWDAMLGLGRAETNEEKLDSYRQQVEQIQNELARASSLGKTQGGSAYVDELKKALTLAQAQAAAIGGVVSAQQSAAKASADGNEMEKLKIKWLQEGDKYLTKSLIQKKEIDRVTAEGEQLIKARLLEREDLEKRIAAIREKYNDNTGQSEVASIKAKTLAQQQYLDILKTQGLEAQKMTEGEKLVIQIKEQLATSLTGVQRAEKLRALAAAEALAVVDKQVQGEERRLEGIKKSKEAYDQMVDATRKSADQLKTQADELEASNAMWGKGKAAIEAYKLSLLEARAKEIDRNPDHYRADFLAAFYDELTQQRRKLTATQTAEYKALLDKQNEWLRSAQEEAQLYQDEIGLLGLTTREREKVVAVRQVELKLAKEIAAINKSGATDDQKAVLIAQAESAAAIAKQTAAAKADMASMTDIINSVDRTAQQVWTNIWQGGSNVFQKLGQTIKASVLDLLYQLTIKKWVVSVTADIVGGISGMTVGSALGSAGGSSLLSSGINALGLTGTGSALGTAALGTVQGWLGMSGTAAQTSAAMMQAYGAGSAAGIASTIGSYMPQIAAAMAAYSVLSSLNGGESRSGGQYGVAYDGAIRSNRRGETYTSVGDGYQKTGTGQAYTNGQSYLVEASGLGAAQDAAINTAISSTAASIQGLLTSLGSSARVNQFYGALETSSNGRGGNYVGGSFLDGTTFGSSGKGDNYSGTLYDTAFTRSPDLQTALANLKTNLLQTTVQALQAATDIPKTIKDMLSGVDAKTLTDTTAADLIKQINDQITAVNSLGNLAKALPLKNLKDLSFDAASGLIKLAGSLDTLTSQVSSYYSNFYTGDEKQAQTIANLAGTFQSLGLVLPEFTSNAQDAKKAFRDIIAGIDLSTAAGQAEFETLMGIQQAFSDAADYAQSAAQSASTAAQTAATAAEQAASTAKQNAIDAANSAYTALSNAVSAQKAILQDAVTSAQAAVTTIGGIFDTLKSNVTELYNSVATTQAQSQRQALQFIDQALAAAQAGGGLPDGTKLSDAIIAARSGLGDTSSYASLFEQQRAQLILAGKLAQLQDIAGVQKSVAQQQLDAANQQIDQLDQTLAYWKQQVDIATGTYEATLSVADAIQALTDAITGASKANATAKPGVSVVSDVTSGPVFGGTTTGGSGSSASAVETGAGTGRYLQWFNMGGDQWVSGLAQDSSAIARFDAAASAYQAASGDLAALAASGFTQADIASGTGQPLATVQAIFDAAKIPRFAVGTNYVPNDMLAVIHQGEAVVPKAYNPAAGGVLQGDGQVAQLLVQLIAEVQRLGDKTDQTNEWLSGQNGPLVTAAG